MIESLLKVLGILFPVFACVGLGTYYAWRFKPTMTTVNTLNMDVFAPILVFWVIFEKPFAISDYTMLALGGVLIVLCSGLILLPLTLGRLGRSLKLSPKTFIPPMMFSNTGNMGIPLVLFAFGEQALQAAIILFIIEMVLHFTLGLFILDYKTNPLIMLKMPMIQATALGLFANYFEVRLPEPINNTLSLLAQVAIPLLLFSLGVRLLDIQWRDWKMGLLGAVASPLSGLIVAFCLLPFLALDSIQSAQLLLFAALPPAVLNVLVAEQFNQEPEKVASLVIFGNLGSLVIMPPVLWYALYLQH